MDSDSSREAFYSDPAHASIKKMYNGAFRNTLKAGDLEPVSLAADETFGVQLNHSSTNGRSNQWVNIGYEFDFDRGLEYSSVRLEVIDPLQLRLGKSALRETIRLYEGDRIKIGSRRFPDFQGVALDAAEFLLFDTELRKNPFSGEVLASGISVRSNDTQHGATLFTARDSYKNIFEQFMRDQERIRRERAKHQSRPRTRPQVPIDTYRREYTSLTAEAMEDIVNRVSVILHDSSDMKSARRAFERAFHPDRHAGVPPQDSHQAYLLANRIFEDLSLGKH